MYFQKKKSIDKRYLKIENKCHFEHYPKLKYFENKMAIKKSTEVLSDINNQFNA
jgi:hypothetical protein